MTSRAKISGQSFSNPFQVFAGTRQGSLLSPLFFLVFIGDLFIDLENSGVGVSLSAFLLSALGLADDVAVATTDASGMAEQLMRVTAFSRRWHLPISLVKSAAMLFPASLEAGTIPTWVFTLAGEDLPWTDAYLYLGYEIQHPVSDFALGLTPRFQAAKAALDRAFAVLIRHQTSPEDRLQVCKNLVFSTLDAGTEALGLDEEDLESIDLLEADYVRTLECGSLYYHTFSARWVKRRETFLQKMAGAPYTSWRNRIWREIQNMLSQ
eukprot:Lithocolla_globosa_v1_NODE_253_length_4814_cov_57.763606.p2 type:complete len:266 gc:universal NODE_253_length_4814_cov_57.763606:1872-1075(-)